MTKKKIEPETEVPEETIPNPGKKRMFIPVLAVLCVVGGVFVWYFNRPTTVVMKSPLPSVVRPVAQMPAPVVQTAAETVLTEPIQPATTSASEPIVDTPAFTPLEQPTAAATDTETTAEPAPEPALETVPVEQPVPELLSFHSKLAAGTAKLADLLALRDDFANNDSCMAAYQKLLALEPKTPLLQKTIDALEPFCMRPEPVLTELNQTFLKAKKRAVLAYYKAKYPKWWFIKAIPVFAFEIRRLNPTGRRPIDNLYRAHNALLRQDIDKSVRYVDELPPLMRAQMDDFVQAATVYARASAALDAVILSFEKGE